MQSTGQHGACSRACSKFAVPRRQKQQIAKTGHLRCRVDLKVAAPSSQTPGIQQMPTNAPNTQPASKASVPDSSQPRLKITGQSIISTSNGWNYWRMWAQTPTRSSLAAPGKYRRQPVACANARKLSRAEPYHKRLKRERLIADSTDNGPLHVAVKKQFWLIRQVVEKHERISSWLVQAKSKNDGNTQQMRSHVHHAASCLGTNHHSSTLVFCNSLCKFVE